MKVFWIVLLTFAASAHAQKSPSRAKAAAAAPNETAQLEQNFRVDARLGVLTERIDQEAAGRWNHNTGGSFAGYLGGYYMFPPSWKQLKFLAGIEMGYFSSQEKIDQSELDTKMYSLGALGGVMYQPAVLAGWGGELRTGVQIYGSKQSTFSSPGFSHDVGKSSTGLTFLVALGAFYAIDANWRVTATIDNSKALALGVSYAF
jgi:hypothetical protein